MQIFGWRIKNLKKITEELYRYIGGGQIIYLSPEGEYYQANLVDVTLTDSRLREIILKVEGYRKLFCTESDSHSCTVIGGIKVEIKLIKFNVEFMQVQKKKTLKERIRLYCKSGTIYFIPQDHPLCLVYDNTTLVKGPTREYFVSQMREKNLKP